MVMIVFVMIILAGQGEGGRQRRGGPFVIIRYFLTFLSSMVSISHFVYNAFLIRC